MDDLKIALLGTPTVEHLNLRLAFSDLKSLHATSTGSTSRGFGSITAFPLTKKFMLAQSSQARPNNSQSGLRN